MTSPVALQAHDLHKRFGRVQALAGVSLRAERGRVVGFLGPNGAGKTTTIGILLGLVRPTMGTVEMFGEPLRANRTRMLHRVGAMVGQPALLPNLSARQNLQCAACLHPGLPAGRIDQVLDAVGLASVAGRRAGTFSAGMKQRLGLALATLHRPDLLLLDEPGSGLDPEGVHQLRTLLRSLADEGAAVFLSSHQLHEVELICDQVIVVHRGQVVTEGSVAELRRGFPERVSIATANREQTARALAELPQVRDVEVSPDRVLVSGVPSQVVLHHLVTRGLTPSEVSIERPDLEEMFLQLTKEA